MFERISKLPVLVLLTGLSAFFMLVPMAHAIRIADFLTARIFLQYSILVLLMVVLVALATANYGTTKSPLGHLLSLLAGFVLLPLVLALPFSALKPNVAYFDVYFEMLSSFTTTGATLFDDPKRLSEPLHLWRALVGWLGGLIMWIAAVAIMAPLNLGGYEITSAQSNVRGRGVGAPSQTNVGNTASVLKFARIFAPVYLVLTFFLTLGLVMSGDRFFVAVVHAMSTVSTSGISSVSGLENAHSGLVGEVLIFAFLLLAVSRATISFAPLPSYLNTLGRDKEFRLMVIIITIIPFALFLRHWLGAFEVNEHDNLTAGLKALWGMLFTVLSFLTTTGFVSDDWATAQNWSGLGTPGMILIGLAIMGGGVATTAGGVKLLRVYALYKHGLREMQKLPFPASVGGYGLDARRIRREGAYYAWVFTMLFAISIALAMLGLSLSGLDFEAALILAISALSTTGPLAAEAGEYAIGYGSLGAIPKAILAAAMVLGRFEVLAIVALMNPDFWRK